MIKDTIKLDFLDIEIDIFIWNNFNSIVERLGIYDLKKEDKHFFADFIGYEKETGKTGYAILFNFENELKKINHGTISHECLHAINYIFDVHGMETGFSDDEFEAYLLGYLVNKVITFLKKYDYYDKLEVFYGNV